MSQYFFDPEDYAVGDGIADLPFTHESGTLSTCEIQQDEFGDKFLHIDGSDPLLSWDDVPSTLYAQSYQRGRYHTTALNTPSTGFAYRIDSAGTDWYAHRTRFTGDRYLHRGTSNITNASDTRLSIDEGDFINARAEVYDDGGTTRHRIRTWADGDSEGATWYGDVAHDSLSTSGKVGIFNPGAPNLHLYAFGVGTDGDEAPTAAPGAADRTVSAALELAGPTIAAEAEVQNEVAAALQLAGPTISAEAKVLSELTAALELAGPTLEAEVFTTPIRVLSAALVLAGPTISAEAEVQNDLEAALQLTGPTVAVDAAVVAKVEAALELAGPTIAAEVSPQDLNTLAAALQLAPPEISAELSRPPRLARLILTLTDAINLNLTLED